MREKKKQEERKNGVSKGDDIRQILTIKENKSRSMILYSARKYIKIILFPIKTVVNLYLSSFQRYSVHTYDHNYVFLYINMCCLTSFLFSSAHLASFYDTLGYSSKGYLWPNKVLWYCHQ